MFDDRGVSPVIGTLLVLAMFMTVTGVVVTVGRPALIEFQEQGQFDAVSGQLAQVAGHMRQIAVAGTQYEVRQPSVAFPNGHLSADSGHWVVLTVSYFDEEYAEAIGQTSSPWTLTRFGFDPYGTAACDRESMDGPDATYCVRFFDSDHSLLMLSVRAEAYRYDDGVWVLRHTQTGSHLNNTYCPCDLQGTLDERPWRINLVEDQPVGADRLLAHIFIFKTPRITYAFDAHAGPRYVHIENGAVFRERDGRLSQMSPSLVAAPDPEAGNTAMTMRALDFAPKDVSAGGKTKAGVLMRSESSELFAYNAGAAWMNVQVWGPYPEAWYEHFEGQGFVRAEAPFHGVTYAQTDADGDYVAFPFHFVYATLDLTVRTA